jgi:uncharacterized membrane protein
MNKMIVAVFDTERQAYQGMTALEGLHAEGSLTVHSLAVVGKDPNGAISVKRADEQAPVGTAVGLATGSLLGLIGGPVGVAVGATVGTLTGSIYDVATLGVGDDFLLEVSDALTPGKVAVLADADEEWVTPLDSRIGEIGGVVFRRARGEFFEEQIERELAVERAELALLKAEYKEATGEAKARLKNRLDEAQRKFDARRELLKQRIEVLEQEAAARIHALQDQLATATNAQKAKLQQRIDKARADHKARTQKLNAAWELVKEAASI